MQKLLAIGGGFGLNLLITAPAFADEGVPGLNKSPDQLTLPDVVNVLAYIIKFGLAFAAAVGALFIVVAGYQYVVAAGNPEKIEKAKMGLTWAIGGFIIAISAFAIVNTLQIALQQNQRSRITNVLGGLGGPEQLSDTLGGLGAVVVTFGGAAAVLFLIIGGYRYITSQGNPELIEKAKQNVLYAVIGLGIVMLAGAIFATVHKVLVH